MGLGVEVGEAHAVDAAALPDQPAAVETALDHRFVAVDQVAEVMEALTAGGQEVAVHGRLVVEGLDQLDLERPCVRKGQTGPGLRRGAPIAEAGE
ncbi:MAG: hypothetical protein P8Y10_12440 [Gemmatimonadales bacterium]